MEKHLNNDELENLVQHHRNRFTKIVLEFNYICLGVSQ